ncbi:putative nwd2 protein [Mycena sanguinolenta]|uniref:Putative nwd2 protein n=1 Tax=Mycena sanguinolenta TaxID=230812 RepID=A0A8H7DH41_9AGAR|nr:putative nwd2 protein [Mycena sanguinolenta]
MNSYHYYVTGGTGGAGGPGYENGAGGAGGQGTGPSLNFDIQSSGSFTVNNVQQRERGIDILHRAATLEAIHDSTDSFMEPKCHPETRTGMLKDLLTWALDPHPKTTILWLYGPAGAGKTAIMRTLATQLHEKRRLGGCFFFKRGHVARNNARTLFTTIAYQLALNVKSLQTPISRVAEKNPSIVGLSIGTQMQQLISEPCRTHENRRSLAIVIDGLDECDGHAFQGEILRAILNPSSNHAIFLRFIIASRPEPQISKMFPLPDHSCNYHRFNVEQSFDDVRKYLCHEFSRIHRDHPTMTKIPSPWPGPRVLEELVQKSSGYFIYASTIIKFIDDENYRPTARLALVQDGNRTGSESAFGALDQLYMTVLRSSPRQSELTPILSAIVHLEELGAGEIDLLLGLEEGETGLILRNLQSVLEIPADDDSEISSHHASFLDFLCNANRSQAFYVGSSHHRMDLARCLLKFCFGGDNRRILKGEYSKTRPTPRRTLSQALIPFITSLPPTSELCPPIGLVDPSYIFLPNVSWGVLDSNLKCMLSWLAKVPSAPPGVFTLWSDYSYMFLLAKAIYRASFHPPPMSPGQDCINITSPSPKLLQVLVGVSFVCSTYTDVMFQHILVLLDVTWDELRTIICSHRSISPEPRRESAPQYSHPDEIYRWVSRDIALRCIRAIVDNHVGAASSLPDEIHQEIVRKALPFLVRWSPPCPALYQKLCSITCPILWAFESAESFIYHVAKWLESFPGGPKLELITFWMNGRTPGESMSNVKVIEGRIHHYSSAEEMQWGKKIDRWNDFAAYTLLPDQLKLPL